MPYSYSLYKDHVKEHMIINLENNIKILDIGAGCGTYSHLIRENFPNLDGVEIFEPYIDQFELRKKYNNLYNTNVLDMDLSQWDYFIMGDVVEHMSVMEAKNLIEKLHSADKLMLIAVPYNYEQGVEFNNVHEVHQQPDLTKEIFLERYPCMRFLCGDDKYGYFVNYEYQGNNQ